MKIFSLQSKTSLVGWSVVFGLVLNIVFSAFIRLPVKEDVDMMSILWPKFTQKYTIGFPLKEQHIGVYPLQCYGTCKRVLVDPNFIWFVSSWMFFANLIFWILVVFIILSLIRYFKYKKV